MCGSYYIHKDIYKQCQLKESSSDKYPGDKCLLLIPQPLQLTWGIKRGNKRIFNIRSETVLTRYKEDMEERRCLIPVSHFYEWDIHHSKISFTTDKTLYLAGFYTNTLEFVILTTESNDSIKPYHPRMPLIINEEDKKIWFSDDYASLIRVNPIKLENNSTYEQLSFDF